MEVPEHIIVREVWMWLNCTLQGASELTVEDEGEVKVWSHAHSIGEPDGVITAKAISVRAGGKMEALTADSAERMQIRTTTFTVNGLGYFRTNTITITTHNLTVDVAGMYIITCHRCHPNHFLLCMYCFIPF